MKTIVNVYKDHGLWKYPPPGIGDYLRGCCYLHYKSRMVKSPGFVARANLDLSPASRFLDYESVHHPGERQDLIDAKEYFEPERDGDVDQTINDFLRSDRETLYLSTNRSWRGVDDEPDRAALDHTAKILNFSPAFGNTVYQKTCHISHPYMLLHIRDSDRSKSKRWMSWDAWRFRLRVAALIRKKIHGHTSANQAIVCVSNNEPLRDHLCQKHGYINLQTEVQNTGHKGILSEGELLDMALMKSAASLTALSYFGWNSGFSVWVTRLFGVPATYYNRYSRL